MKYPVGDLKLGWFPETAMGMKWRVVGPGMVLLLALAAGRTGKAFQRSNPSPSPSPNYPSPMGASDSGNLPRANSLEDQPALRELEERRGKAINTERQRMMIKEANQLVQAAADLQVSVNKGIDGAGREEQAKRAESIEKLARDVKERMKGGR